MFSSLMKIWCDILIRLLYKFKRKSIDGLPSLLQKAVLAYEDGLAGHSCEVHVCWGEWHQDEAEKLLVIQVQYVKYDYG